MISAAEAPVTARRSIGDLDHAVRVNTPNYDYYYLCTELRRKRMIPVITRVRAKSVEEFGDLVHHSGEEFIYIVSGRIVVHTEFYDPVTLDTGESIYIDLEHGPCVCRGRGLRRGGGAGRMLQRRGRADGSRCSTSTAEGDVASGRFVRSSGRTPSRQTLMKPLTEAHLAILRRHMVEVIDIEFDLLSEEIERPAPSQRVREALLAVPRHLFVPAQFAALAYQDSPLPIGFDKTISQPFMTALMTELLDPQEGDSVLEVGTGLGYQTAILAGLAAHVWSVEIVEEFAGIADARLVALGYRNVAIRIGDGSRGWAEAAPFDAILVSAAAKELPEALVGQLKPEGGRLVMPLGEPGRSGWCR
ncbi:protein-L-isoaspartate(D-aspartate) O-methyltransferase [Sphingomonas sp. 7/4-4]|uniref:protein-L-isoaspartate(D-aspartate) O-methyltransferase n=1 Tax=Sphingomonas sp. 7/4-4 TaxID=3018446 RepID=UPI00300DEF35